MNITPSQRAAFALTMTQAFTSVTSLIISRRRRKRRRKRQFGVHPINLQRNITGLFCHLYQETRNYPARFYVYTRMSIAQFDYLLELIGPTMPRLDVLRHCPMPNEMRLVITLRFLAAGDSIHSLASSYRIGDSTCRKIIKEVCKAIIDALLHVYVKAPTKEEYLSIAEEFGKKWNLPHCLGAIDGKHVTIKAPPNSGSVYFNYKKQFSINLLGVCDANYCFTVAEVGYLGILSDGGVFRMSEFGQNVLEETLEVPDPQDLPNTTSTCPFFFVADEAFPLKHNMMIPYGRDQLKERDALAKRIFNYRLSRARRVIENSFGILASRWRIFHRVIEAFPETAVLYVQACVCLHNYLMKTKPIGVKNPPKGYYGDVYNRRDERSVEGLWRESKDAFSKTKIRSGRHPLPSAKAVRELLTNYVTNVNCLDYQVDYVNRGFLRVDENQGN